METSPAIQKEVIESCRGGDRRAFEEIVRRYQRKVYNLAYRMLGHREEAKDVSQEVFISIFESIKNLKDDAKLEPWLTQIALNHCRNRFKYLMRRRYFRTEPFEEPRETEDGAVGKGIPSPSDDPEALLEKKMIQQVIHRGLLQLREDQRELIVLRDLQEHSYETLAEILGLPLGTIKSKLHRARMDLKAILERSVH